MKTMKKDEFKIEELSRQMLIAQNYELKLQLVIAARKIEDLRMDYQNQSAQLARANGEITRLHNLSFKKLVKTIVA